MVIFSSYLSQVGLDDIQSRQRQDNFVKRQQIADIEVTGQQDLGIRQVVGGADDSLVSFVFSGIRTSALALPTRLFSALAIRRVLGSGKCQFVHHHDAGFRAFTDRAERRAARRILRASPGV